MAPTTISLLFVVGTFVLAGLLHPQEIKCLPMGVIYFVTIPSMYLFLVIYSVFNLNNVSWGTREVPKKKTAQEMEEEKIKAEEEAKQGELKRRKNSGSFWGRFLGGDSGDIARMFHRSSVHDTELKKDISRIKETLDSIEKALSTEGNTTPAKKMAPPPVPANKPKVMVAPLLEVETAPPEHQDDLKDPYWIRQKNHVGNGPRKRLSIGEVDFWFELIEKYLKPLDKDVEKEKQQKQGLVELRNQCAFSLLMINGIWVLALFLLQENKRKLYITWPMPGAKEDLQLEPLGLVFLLVFASILLLQLIGNIFS